jgi:DNA-binding transcriptional MerR regulator
MRNVDHTPGLPAPEIPDKLYFRIGDVSRLASIKPFVLRFWESEFPQLSPKKSGTGHRLYRRKDVEIVLEIKRLLYEERFTIEGARNYLQSKGISSTAVKAESKKKRRAAESQPAHQTELFESGIPQSTLEDIRTELRAILDLLS